MAKTKISWTDYSWPVLNGCRRKSTGCEKCYAERLTATRLRHLPQYAGLATYGANGAQWSGETRLNVDELSKPLTWRKPRRIFVCQMGDLFYERNTNEQIAAVCGVIAACPQHEFQICTKRPERAAEWYEWIKTQGSHPETSVLHCATAHLEMPPSPPVYRWPLPNLHLLTSCENQQYADERIPWLLKCPAAVRGVSLEPLLGPIDISPLLRLQDLPQGEQNLWVILGCESGPKRRPCELEWMLSLVEQCREAGVPVHVKQVSIDGRVSHDMSEWPEALRVRMWPGEAWT